MYITNRNNTAMPGNRKNRDTVKLLVNQCKIIKRIKRSALLKRYSLERDGEFI